MHFKYLTYSHKVKYLFVYPFHMELPLAGLIIICITALLYVVEIALFSIQKRNHKLFASSILLLCLGLISVLSRLVMYLVPNENQYVVASFCHVTVTAVYVGSFNIYLLQILKLLYVLTSNLDPIRIQIIQSIIFIVNLAYVGSIIIWGFISKGAPSSWANIVESSLVVGGCIFVVLILLSLWYEIYLCWKFAKKKLMRRSQAIRLQVREKWKRFILNAVKIFFLLIVDLVINTLANVAKYPYVYHEILVAIALFIAFFISYAALGLFEDLKAFMALVILDPILIRERCEEQSEKLREFVTSTFDLTIPEMPSFDATVKFSDKGITDESISATNVD